MLVCTHQPLTSTDGYTVGATVAADILADEYLARVRSILWNRPACHRSFPHTSTPSLVPPPLNTTSTPCLRSMHNRHPTHTSSCSGAKDTSTARVSVMWMSGRGRPAARRNKTCDGDRTWHRQKLVRWHLIICMYARVVRLSQFEEAGGLICQR
ncbi:hypothetical protein BGW80DRAFT_1306541 [Lactifluus volemus]|nr:hypothetical protein BGW80DRAFT_1306541 [Lactifluus volemus]